MSEFTGKIIAKAANGKGFRVEGEEGWFNATDTVVPYLAKFSKGDTVTLTYDKKGVQKNVTMIKGAFVPPQDTPAEKTTSTVDKYADTGFKCEVCHKGLKDGKYPKCYTCGKKAKEEGPTPTKTTSYNNPERDAMIQRGNALNASAAAVSGNYQGCQPADIAEAVILIANRLLEWLRAE
jgi:hypothetical protein